MSKLCGIIPVPIAKLLRIHYKARWRRRLRLNHQEGSGVVEAVVGGITICDLFSDNGALTIVYTEEAKGLSYETTKHEFTYYYADPNSFDIDKIVDKIYSLYKREIDVHRYDIPEWEEEQKRMPQVTIEDLKNKLASEEVNEPDF